MKTSKERIDTLLVQKGFFPTRERAQAALMAGSVLVDEQKVDKQGTKVDVNANIRIVGQVMKYVSRGGLKLEKALRVFEIDLLGAVVADIGASTGGFTDCALQNDAKKVYAVDVGYGQLAWKLRTDERVINIERVNARYLSFEQLPDKIDFMTIDVSFISLGKILPCLKGFLQPTGKIIALVKPQFEAGKGNIGKKGVVKDAFVHVEVLQKVIGEAQNEGFVVCGLDFSPITGPEGNIEYLLYLGFTGSYEYCIEKVVQDAHLMHNNKR